MIPSGCSGPVYSGETIGFWRPGFLLVAMAVGLLPSARAETSPLHVDGSFLRDAHGQVVVLRGINHAGFVDSPDGGWDRSGCDYGPDRGHWDPDAIKASLSVFQRLGFNVVRLHTIVAWWKENPRHFWTYAHPLRRSSYPEAYRDMIKDVIRWAGQRGLYVIFDFYALDNSRGISTGQESLPWPPFCKGRGIVDSRAAYLEIWKSVARELGGFPNVLFEFYNEPHGTAAEKAAWFDFCQEAINTVRAYTQNPVIIQWDFMAWVFLDSPSAGRKRGSTLDWVGQYPLTGTNLVYGTHLYRNTGAGPVGTVNRLRNHAFRLWQAADLDDGLRLCGFLDVVERLHKPVLVTEIGPYMRYRKAGEQEHEYLWLQNTTRLLNAWSIGYIGWAWASDRVVDHGMLHDGRPNAGGTTFLRSLQKIPAILTPSGGHSS